MAYQIRFEGSDKIVTSEHGESILESAIRAGLGINYGCSNGNCGLCVARLITGDIKQITHHDYHLDADQVKDGKILMCTHTATQDLTLEIDRLESADYIEPYKFPAKVRSVTPATEQVRILTLQPSRSHRLRFFAGQYGRIRKKTMLGEYAIASCPCDARRLEFHIEHTPNDDFCDYVFNHCSSGDALELEAPFGSFSFSKNMQRPLVFVAFGMGFAAIKSLLEHITAQESEVPICLYWVAGKGGHYLDNLCCSWDDALDQLHYQRVTADIHSPTAAAECMSHILEQQSHLADADLYCCVPGGEVLTAVHQAAQRRPATWHFFCERIHALADGMAEPADV